MTRIGLSFFVKTLSITDLSPGYNQTPFMATNFTSTVLYIYKHVHIMYMYIINIKWFSIVELDLYGFLINCCIDLHKALLLGKVTSLGF